MQPAVGANDVACNGTRVATSRWLRDGDVVSVAATRVRIAAAENGLRLRVEHAAGRARPAPSPSPDSRREAVGHDPVLRPVEFRPLASRRGSAGPTRPRWGSLLVPLGVLPLLVLVWYVFTARSVLVQVQPAPDRFELSGGVLRPTIGGRYLLLPGSYAVRAAAEGHRELDVTIDVGSEPRQTFEFELERLPGRLRIDAGDVEGAVVAVGGEPPAPLTAPLELESGPHTLRVSADGYAELVTEVVVEGGGATQTLEVELEALPPRASPAERPRPTTGQVHLDSQPPGAAVTVDGEFRGETPLALEAAPGAEHVVVVSKPGHEPATLRLTLRPGEERRESVALEPRLGTVTVEAQPPDAELLVDGEPRGRVGQTLELTAEPHEIVVRREGYDTHTTTITPRPGVPQALRVRLTNPEQRLAELPDRIEGPNGHVMVLVRGGRLVMGAPRREAGRRANEVERDVVLTRPYFVGIAEVTNDQFRVFRPEHRSGEAEGTSLEAGHHPVVRVSWEDAAAYCNWLSGLAGLPPAYVDREGELSPVVPPNDGYRLPTEPEWAWAARGGGTSGLLKYPWGDTLPVPDGAGNYADASAQPLLARTLPDYDDGYPVTAPVDAFQPSARGLFNMGGNVSEWVQDYYGVDPGSSEPEPDPRGPADGQYHVIRGASYLDSTISDLRLSRRDYGKGPLPDVGFRIARSAGE